MYAAIVSIRNSRMFLHKSAQCDMEHHCTTNRLDVSMTYIMEPWWSSVNTSTLRLDEPGARTPTDSPVTNVDLGETGNVVVQVQWSDAIMQIATKCLENMSLPHKVHEMKSW